ncbi:MAG: nickel pincer cofactor biosynthesis protein LarC [Actinomycetota bacterium]|nr:nickel pincer cofactor biosynthesis protein LarC [Actinomycetota bacterium]
MKIAYFNCFAGISGDMIVGALIDLGLPLEKLEDELGKIALGNYEIKARPVLRQGISATKFDVISQEQKVIRTWSNIRELIEDSKLPDKIKADSLAIFKRIAEAEAKIHKKAVDQVHFHEVGATDSIVDVISSVIGIDYLDIEKIYSSPVATGIGMVKTEHGVLPLPTPAVLEILADAPIYSSGISAELTTPTGAAVLMQYAEFSKEIPQMVLEKTGYGAGSQKLEIPNVLRILTGETVEEVGGAEVLLIETNIDDVPAEILGYTMESLMETGALDVWFTPIEMKKNRPAVMLSVLVSLGSEEPVIDKIFSETSTLGLRISKQSRRVAERETIKVDTPLGKIRVKVGTYKGKVISIAPEYEDCKKAAFKQGIPIKEVYDLARKVAAEKIGRG